MEDGIMIRTLVNINPDNKEAVVQLARQLFTIGAISHEGLSSIENLAKVYENFLRSE